MKTNANILIVFPLGENRYQFFIDDANKKRLIAFDPFFATIGEVSNFIVGTINGFNSRTVKMRDDEISQEILENLKKRIPKDDLASLDIIMYNQIKGGQVIG